MHVHKFDRVIQERHFVYDFEDHDYHADDRSAVIRPVFGKGSADSKLPADLAKSYSFHGEGAAVVPSYVVTVSPVRGFGL